MPSNDVDVDVDVDYDIAIGYVIVPIFRYNKAVTGRVEAKKLLFRRS